MKTIQSVSLFDPNIIEVRNDFGDCEFLGHIKVLDEGYYAESTSGLSRLCKTLEQAIEYVKHSTAIELKEEMDRIEKLKAKQQKLF